MRPWLRRVWAHFTVDPQSGYRWRDIRRWERDRQATRDYQLFIEDSIRFHQQRRRRRWRR
ncbi:hypothetical protein [Prauserella endophytica]|uniref:Transposase n=1 Tax=Prauserella endophytica TaxID=1592324 RepID=A0ABY2RZZ6_9PSEU|nr:hypothetical protein [Prauserella endophytica]TKG66940.1 hypothetical protein FCN18_23810 [Prauserella endophytica]